eukprot:UN4785
MHPRQGSSWDRPLQLIIAAEVLLSPTRPFWLRQVNAGPDRQCHSSCFGVESFAGSFFGSGSFGVFFFASRRSRSPASSAAILFLSANGSLAMSSLLRTFGARLPPPWPAMWDIMSSIANASSFALTKTSSVHLGRAASSFLLSQVLLHIISRIDS